MLGVPFGRLRKRAVLAPFVALMTLVTLEPGSARAQQGEFGEPQQHNLDMLNFYRGQAGVAPLQLDPFLNDFAFAGSLELDQDHIPHKHFRDSGLAGFETQGYPFGTPIVGWPGAPNIDATIDQVLASMMAEPLPPPGGLNHHAIIINPSVTRVGVGLVLDGVHGTLYFTNDFTQ